MAVHGVAGRRIRGHAASGPPVRSSQFSSRAGVSTYRHRHAGARHRRHDRDLRTLNAVLLKPLPYPKSEHLYNLRTTLTDGRITTGLLSNGEVSRLNGPDLSIVRAAGMQPADLTLLHDDGTPQRIKIYGVTEGFFELFGLPMTLGGLHPSRLTVPPPPPPPPAPARSAGRRARRSQRLQSS